MGERQFQAGGYQYRYETHHPMEQVHGCLDVAPQTSDRHEGHPRKHELRGHERGWRPDERSIRQGLEAPVSRWRIGVQLGTYTMRPEWLIACTDSTCYK